MRTHYLIACLSVLMLIGGCVPSLHALYMDGDLVFDPALVGRWGGEGTESFIFTKEGDGKSYKVVYTDKDGKSGEFEAHLVVLKGNKFLDLFPDEPEMPQNDLYKGHLIPTHTFWRVDQIGAKLRLADLDYDWTKKFLAQHPTELAHEWINKDEIVLTASTVDLQKFVIDHVHTEGAFKTESEFSRAAEGAGPATAPVRER